MNCSFRYVKNSSSDEVPYIYFFLHKKKKGIHLFLILSILNVGWNKLRILFRVLAFVPRLGIKDFLFPRIIYRFRGARSQCWYCMCISWGTLCALISISDVPNLSFRSSIMQFSLFMNSTLILFMKWKRKKIIFLHFQFSCKYFACKKEKEKSFTEGRKYFFLWRTCLTYRLYSLEYQSFALSEWIFSDALVGRCKWYSER